MHQAYFLSRIACYNVRGEREGGGGGGAMKLPLLTNGSTCGSKSCTGKIPIAMRTSTRADLTTTLRLEGRNTRVLANNA